MKTSGVRVIWKPGSFKNKGPGGGGAVFPCVQGLARRPMGPERSGCRGARPGGGGPCHLDPRRPQLA